MASSEKVGENHRWIPRWIITIYRFLPAPIAWPWRPQFLASHVKNAAVQGALLLKAPLAVPRSPLLMGGQNRNRNNTLQLATCLAIKWLVAWERVDINTVRLQPLQGYGVPVWVEHSRTTSHKVLGWATTKRKQLPCKVSLASSAFSCFSGFSDWEDRGSSAGCPLVEGSAADFKVALAGWQSQHLEIGGLVPTASEAQGPRLAGQARHHPCQRKWRGSEVFDQRFPMC